MPTLNFLDQFKDITVDLSSFFSDYDITFSNEQGNTVTLKNIFEVTKFDPDLIKDNKNFYRYRVENNDPPDVVAKKVYGNRDFWWVVYISNNIKNPFTEWLLSDDQIYEISKFMSDNEDKFSFDGYYNILDMINEERREIFLLRKENLTKLIKIIKNKLKS